MNLFRKLSRQDEAVSPVIAVILMVAITVVLAATVYVWVSGFGSQSSQPAKTISLTSSAALSNQLKAYTVASATAGMKWSDISITINGATYNNDQATACSATSLATATSWQTCSGSSTKALTAVIGAGDTLRVANVASGQTLRVLDSQANSVILTLTIG